MRQAFTVRSSSEDGVVVQTMTALRFERVTSEMCGRSLAGAALRNALSVDSTSFELFVNAIVTVLFDGEVAMMPPFSAKPAMKPTLAGLLETFVKPFDFRHAIDPCAVNGVFERAPQPAASSARRTRGGTTFRTATKYRVGP